jgi:uncharacterized protein YfbU (UPF0304 family)/Arc/MetJ-type ribon-helix-helix transcriptional regulator
MAQITVSLPDDLADQVKRAAGAAGYATVSDFVRDALREKFSGLTYWQRVHLVTTLRNNQLLEGIAESVQAKSPDLWSFRKSTAALEEGFPFDYGVDFQFINRGEFTEQQAKFVIQTLAMYDDLQRTAEKSGNDTLQELARFPGFDGNNETSYMAYARFLMEVERRFDYLHLGMDGLNSHIGTITKYKEMLDRWESVKRHAKESFEYTPLTVEEMKEVLGVDNKHLGELKKD